MSCSGSTAVGSARAALFVALRECLDKDGREMGLPTREFTDLAAIERGELVVHLCHIV